MCRDEIVRRRKKLQKFRLEQDQEDENEINQTKMNIEALDFDWVFVGNNAANLLEILAQCDNPAALTKKSLKTFIDLMWKNYQPVIIKRIFFPYCFYLVILSYLSGFVSPDFIAMFDTPLKDQDEDFVYWFHIRLTKAYVFTSLATCLMICFGSLEMSSMVSDGFSYLGDFWNVNDAVSLSFNSSFIICTTIDFIFERPIISLDIINTIGGFACFFMWIKVFYWMRLFEALAYYVKLIVQTLIDSGNFMLMVFIIISAFANFFYVINLNQILHQQGEYYDSYTGVREVDVVISVYMLGALGDFDSTIYRVGYCKAFALFMFLIATFLIAVVFMNMLIAIMGETFGTVTEERNE